MRHVQRNRWLLVALVLLGGAAAANADGIIYGNELWLKRTLAVHPETRWDTIVLKRYAAEKPLATQYPVKQVAMFNLYGRDEQAVYDELNPINPATHADLVDRRAVQAARDGWAGVLFDFEMYGRTPNHFPADMLSEAELSRLSDLWEATARKVKAINPNIVFGGTSCLLQVANPVYDAIVRGVGRVIIWTEYTQATHAAGYNAIVDATVDRYSPLKVRWVGMVQVSRQDPKWFVLTDRWPIDSDWCVNDAEALLKRLETDPDYLEALWLIGAD